MSNKFERNSLYIGLAAAWIAMLGSLYFSEVLGYIPCTLCWYQRILMYPLAGILAVGLLRRDRGAPFYVLPFSLLGIGVSTYHYLIQKTDIFGGETSCQVGVPCTTVWINWLGFITIPFLALTAFVIITIVAFIALQAPEEEEGEAPAGTPWLAVGGVIAAVVIAFGVLTLVNRPDDATASEPPPVTMLTVEGAEDAEAMPVDGTAETETAPTEVAPVERTEEGAALYAASCAGCHGADLTGVSGLGNSLVTSAVVKAYDDETLLLLVRNGRTADDPGHGSSVPMPPNGGNPNLSDAELLAIIQYIRSQVQ